MSLVALWRLDELSGVTAVDKIAGNDGTSVNTIVNDGRGMVFNAIDDSISIADSADFDAVTANGSVCAWVKTDDIAAIHTIIRTESGTIADRWIFQIDVNGKPKYTLVENGVGEDSALANVALVVGEWTHVCATWTTGSGNIKIYVNGILQSTTGTQTAAFTPLYTDLRIGDKSSSEYWDGSISDVRLYDEVLSPSQIRALFDNNSGGINQPITMHESWGF